MPRSRAGRVALAAPVALLWGVRYLIFLGIGIVIGTNLGGSIGYWLGAIGGLVAARLFDRRLFR
jgi:hypothetical protein